MTPKWVLHQILAVFLKKVHTAKRDKRFLFVGLIFPLLATIAVIIVKSLLSKTDESSTFIPIDITSYTRGSTTLIPYIASPGVDPTPLFPYFPIGFQFEKFSSVDTLNSILLYNSSNYFNIVGAYNFININASTFTVSVWFNDSYYRSLPALTKTLTQAIYAFRSNATLDLQETSIELPSGLPGVVNLELIAPTILQYGMMFLLPYFAIQLVAEQEKQLKNILFLNTLCRPAYWVGTFLGDNILFWIPNGISLILMWSFKVSLFSGSNAGPAMLLMFLSAWAGIPFVYIVSFVFDKEETANRWVYSTISILTVIPVTLTSALGAKASSSAMNLLAIVPPFGYFRGLSNLSIGLSITTTCLILFIDGVVYWAIVLMLDYNIFTKLLHRASTPYFTRDPHKEDDDVIRERESVLNYPSQPDEAIRVRDVVKSYDSKFVAVKGVSFRMKAGECFGLLGPNGAGKTSILGVMYGATDADSGDVTVHAHKTSTVQGVCAQFDLLWDHMTGKEHLEIYARIKGLTGNEITEAVSEALDLFGLTQYADQTTVGYSGGTKRKLSSAIALLADPVVVFMDEPSTGMDPVTRRLLWNVIEQKKHGRALLLTTHSMEEAEALCTRVGIMVKGQLRCIGSPQHLRNKYGSGYRLTINTVPGNADKIRSYVNEHYSARTQMAVGGTLNFDIQQESLELHKIFHEMEQVKDQLGILEYCLSQTSLEQVFLRFALEQEDEFETDK